MKRLIAIIVAAIAALAISAPGAFAYVPRWQVTASDSSSAYNTTVYFCAASGGGGTIVSPGETVITDVCSFILPNGRYMYIYDPVTGETLYDNYNCDGANRRVTIGLSSDTQYTAHIIHLGRSC